MYIADLHIHSRYSRATSRDCTPEHLDLSARRKGIQIVGTGDFTHPAWREELEEKLENAEEGLYLLKEEYRIHDEAASEEFLPRFVITGEISSIYKKNGKVRKVHSLILLPSLEAAELISKKLELIGNIHSDGRPILGLDCRDLLEIILEACPKAVFVPAHIWTPHFSLFGAFSGFDTVEECFEDLSPYIHGMETGLSSDPPMNWRVSALDKYQLISNSDAHSPAKLGREANLLDIELGYPGLCQAIQTGRGLYGTIEFFPEEGKYHLDGHRKCNLCLKPSETEGYNGICPVCKRKITVGVSHRVEQLSDRAEGYIRENAKKFESLVPLPEVIAASVGRSPESRGVQKEYRNLLHALGAEFEILRTIPLEEIRRVSGHLISEGIGRLRAGKVERIPGFDGAYGKIRLFEKEELASTEGQMDFFAMLGAQNSAGQAETAAAEASDAKKPGGESQKDRVRKKTSAVLQDIPQEGATRGKTSAVTLNREQESAVRAVSRRIAVIAGPGTGKTKTLIAHICYLLKERRVKPSEITAVTFTNQAAREMKERLQKRNLQIGTFHAICLSFLKAQGMEVTLIDRDEALKIAREVIKEYSLPVREKRFLEQLSLKKSGVSVPEDTALWEAFDAYQETLAKKGRMDFDDLLLKTAELMEKDGSAALKKPYTYLLIDEFQDSNPLQYRLMKAWNESGRELFVIGDPDQAIYGFRGADSRCFEKLKEEYPDIQTIRLTENYRSTPEILKAAGNVISQNPGEERPLHAVRLSGQKVRLVKCRSEMGEAVFAAKEINRLAGGIGMLEAHRASEMRNEEAIRSFDEIAVLCRTHRQMETVEKCLKQEGIPYVAAGREPFLEDETVKRSLSFFRYLENPLALPDREACIRILLQMEENEISAAALEGIAEKFRPLFKKEAPKKFLRQWMEELKLTEHPAMKKLADMTVFYRKMPEFLEELQFGVESDLRRCGSGRYTAGTVTLMTLHGSKGLEFPVTILCGARRGSIPLEGENYVTDREEERRLLYVGMTRAKEELILTCSGEESEFLKDLPEELLHREKEGKKEECGHQMTLFELSF